MDLQSFFNPVQLHNFEPKKGFSNDTWGASLDFYLEDFPSLSNKKMVLIGIKNKNDRKIGYEADNIRYYLYQLKHLNLAASIADLGDIFLEDNKERACQTLGYILGELLNEEVTPVIIGGGQYLTYGQYLAYDYLKKYVNLAVVDNRIDFIPNDDAEISSANFLNKIFYKDPGYLFNCSSIGYQSFFVDPGVVDMHEKYFFDTYRVGNVKGNLSEIEPVIRNANFLSFDINAVRYSDAPGTVNASPNGFTGEEACVLARYAGLSDYLTSIGIYGYEEDLDNSARHTANLIAQMVWYFVEGFNFRDDENPEKQKDGFTKFITTFKNSSYEIIFYKSKKTGRWWMEIPASNVDAKHLDHHFLPCSYQDYMMACQEELPERWWQAIKKLG